MARETLMSFSRANRRGETITNAFVVPPTLAPGVIRITADVHPNQRADTTRWVRFQLHQQVGDQWFLIAGFRWDGNPNTAMPWCQFDVEQCRGETVRGVLHTRDDTNTNVGGIVEWLDWADAEAEGI